MIGRKTNIFFVQTRTGSDIQLLHFNYLPAYANYLLTERLQEFSSQQLALARTYNVPLLKHFEGFAEEEIEKLNKEGIREYLTYLAHNDAQTQIDHSVNKWVQNQLPQVDKYSVKAEDITLITFIRKQSFLNFLKDYTQDVAQMVQIIKETDLLLMASETASTNTYINLLHSHIDEQLHLIQKITNTSPAIIYVFNVKTYCLQFTNRTAQEYSGLSSDELKAFGNTIMQEIMLPEDIAKVDEAIANLTHMKDGEVRQIEHHLRNKDGQFRWMRNYISVFKRNSEGEVEEVIGIIQDVDNEKLAQLQLQEREHQLLEAQNIAQIGSYTWDIKNSSYTSSTPKTLELLELDTTEEQEFFDKVHPADRKKLQDAIEKAYLTGKMECEYRYMSSKGEKVLWSRGVVVYEKDEPVSISGTLMDVTERHHILEELRHSEERFKHAEAITHIGSFEWQRKTNEIIWSDELYRIYGLEPQQQKITLSMINSFYSTKDARNIIQLIDKGLKSKAQFDTYVRVNLKDNIDKILHVRITPIADEQNEIQRIVGSVQDVTEKQTLIQKLRRSENTYKQAEALANMGNYMVNLKTDEVEWTDQLFLIYGLEPQSEKITNERFLSFIHPDDKERVLKTVEQFYISGTTDYIFRIITTKGEVKTLHTIAQLQHDEDGSATYVIGTDQDVTEQQNLIKQFEESERLYKQAQTIAKLGNWRYLLDTGKTIWSDEMYNIYEVDRSVEPTLELITSFIHPDERENVISYFEKCIAEKKPYDRRHQVLLKSGKIKTLQRKGEIKMDANGNVVEVFGTTQDITEQQAFENELKEKQNFIEKIANATPSIIGVYNVNNGNCNFITEGLKKLLGYDTQEALSKGQVFFTGIIHPEDLPAVQAKIFKLIDDFNTQQHNNNIVIDYSYRMRHANGSYHWFQTYSTIFDRNSQGKIEHMLNITIDISAQIEASNKIQEQEHFINQIADASPTILYLYDVAANSIVYINKEIYYVLGYTIEDIIQTGAGITDVLYHPDDIPLLPERKNSDKKFHHLDSMIQYECRMKSKNTDDWCWLLVREVVFKRDDSGNVLQILGSALDISKRKEMEKTLVQNSLLLEQSNASLEEFAYVASHDLKEPLRKISTFGDRLISTQVDRLTDDGKIYLNKIVDASQRMQTMITDLLSISMITGDRSFQPYSLQAILSDVLQTLEYKIEHKNAVVNNDPLPEANIVPSQFRQLFQNLISNSLKFVKEDVQPVITISYSLVDAEEVSNLQLAKAAQYHKLEFKDNGIGFEEEYAGRIFAIFQRLHGRSEYEGTGIGLAICKKIVEHHGGVIYAAGVPDKGATFTIILPA